MERENRRKMLGHLGLALTLADIPTTIIYTNDDKAEITNLTSYEHVTFDAKDMSDEKLLERIVMTAKKMEEKSKQ